jgi:acyl-coenzyme A thioesterase PaaI-like protein
MEEEKRTIRTKKGTKEYTCLGCPLTRNRTMWCFRLCRPDTEGKGRCGRVAPHGLRSRTQLGIESYNKRQSEVHCEKLERLYLSAPCNEYYDPGVRIAAREAEIVIPIQEKFLRAAGTVHSSVCYTAMSDSAILAVNSIVEDALVLSASFNMYLTGSVAEGELVARGRFMDVSGDHYLADSVLTDAQGTEIGRGNGTFVASRIPLSDEIGYRR